jgi:hypothetical protein
MEQASVAERASNAWEENALLYAQNTASAEARAERLADRVRLHARARHKSATHWSGGEPFETCQIVVCRDDRAALGPAPGERLAVADRPDLEAMRAYWGVGEWCPSEADKAVIALIDYAASLERAAGEREQWASIAEQNQALLTKAIEKLAQAERERDEWKEKYLDVGDDVRAECVRLGLELEAVMRERDAANARAERLAEIIMTLTSKRRAAQLLGIEQPPPKDLIYVTVDRELHLWHVAMGWDTGGVESVALCGVVAPGGRWDLSLLWVIDGWGKGGSGQTICDACWSTWKASAALGLESDRGDDRG